jgi:hypothetical protein
MGTPDPYTPPADSESVVERKPNTPSTFSDLLLTLVSVVVLVPVILVEIAVWHEHFAGYGIYDPALGARLPPPDILAAPLLVCVVSVARLSLRRVRFIAPRYRWALTIIAVLAALAAAASRFPEPSFSWGPTGAYFPPGNLPSTPFT